MMNDLACGDGRGSVVAGLEDEKVGFATLALPSGHGGGRGLSTAGARKSSMATDDWEVLPQTRWRTFQLQTDLDDIPMGSISLPAEELEELKKLRLIQAGRVSVGDLKVGDIIFVKGFNLVSLSQKLFHVLSRGAGKQGDPDSVHVMIVIFANGLNAQVAHVTRDGGSMKFIEDPYDPEEFRKNGIELPPHEAGNDFDGVVFRLDSSRELRKKAAAVASELIASYEISYAVKSGIQSAFRDLKAGTFLEEKSTKKPRRRARSFDWSPSYGRLKLAAICGTGIDPVVSDIDSGEEVKSSSSAAQAVVGGAGGLRLESLDSSQLDARTSEQKDAESDSSSCPLKLSLFCSEFVIKCYQEALAHTNRQLDAAEIRVIDLRAEACTPMAFEGFLALNEQSHRDWRRIGRLHAEFT
eukprot:TRINITY_DN19219_c0_g1_i3.p1 TRINITY_DN19219_c0_g1~~TRINITY_DN19219_c0_g1_i3.p1  ORF type:complete len:411 (+),score=102.50 TRINITY_DN19219_c0_g1_i3:18-1250(+)